MGNRAFMLVALLAVSCLPSPASPNDPAVTGDTPAQANPARTLVVAIRGEPGSLNAKRGGGLNLAATRQFFNADLARLDEHESARPYLAETLPQLNTDAWRVFPDGRMETIYRLRPNLTWHNGQPLTSEDFALAWRIYTTTPVGGFDPLPQNLIEEVAAPDPRTVVIRWRQPYPDAGVLHNGFSPLPSHLLSQPLRELEADAFTNLPYWTHEYVGAGPYRLERWEPGTFLEAVAFEGHSLGRARIDRVRLQVISDPNTVVANLLANATHIVVDNAIRFEQGTILRAQWAGANGGVVLLSPSDRRFLQVQFRPELVSPRALLDARARAALAHSTDRQALSDGLLDGQGILMDTLVLPNERWFDPVSKVVVRYPYDSRRAEQLMGELGFARGADGVLASPADGRYSIELRVSAGGQNEQQNDIIVADWRRAGIDATSSPFPVARLQDGQFRASFPALQGSVGGNPNSLISAAIPRPENRWQGSNRGAWVNSTYDRLYELFTTTIDATQRADRLAEAMRVASEELPVIPLYYDFTVTAHVAALRGPRAGGDAWNVYEWSWRYGPS